MFEIFNNIAEMTFVFKDEHLIYANNSACFFTKSYEKSLLKKNIRDIFEDESVNGLYEMLEEAREFEIGLTVKMDKNIKFKVKLMNELDEEFLFIQSVKQVRPVVENKFNRIIAPRMIYDPIKAGKFHIMNYEISDSYMKVQEGLKELGEIPSNKEKVNEIVNTLNDILEEFKSFADEMVDVDQKYVMLNSVFSVNELLKKITSRMNSEFKLENIKAEILCEIVKGRELIVMGDYMKIGSSIVTLVTLLANILIKRNKKAEVLIRLTKDDDFCYIDIISKDVTINKKTYEELITPKTEIINLGRYAENKLTLNIHIVSAYIELNSGELSVKRDRNEGTVMSVKLPLVKKKYFFGEQDNILSCEYMDKIIRKIILYVLNNV